MNPSFRTWLLATPAFLMLAATALAQTPLGTAFTYQGQLKDGGSPASGLHDLRFRLYDALTGGSQVGTTICRNDVSVTDGLFTVPLDFGAQFAGEERFLEIDVRADTGLDCTNPAGFVTLTPRQPLTAAPYALFALNAPGLTLPFSGSVDFNGSALAVTNSHANGKAIAGYSTATEPGFPKPMGVYGESTSINGRGVVGDAPGVSGIGVAGSGGTYGVYGSGLFGVRGDSVADGGRGVYGDASGPGQTYGGYFEATGLNGTGVYGSGNNGVYGAGYEGVMGLATNPDGNGVVGTADGPNGYGVLGQSQEGFGVRGYTNSGTAVFGGAYADSGVTNGVYGQSYSDSGNGVYGLASATSGGTNGVYGQSNSPNGNGVHGRTTATVGDGWGVYGRSDSTGTNAAGVFGLAAASSGTTYGVWGQSESTSGYGVIGISDVQTSGTTYGVYGRSASTNGRGVYGLATAASGTTFAVLGQNSNGSGWGVYALGHLGASGVKAFRIDHPDDPENKYLLHYSTESPEVLNAYSGTIVLDGAGQAVVELPHYFAKINKDPRYTLTAIGAPMPMLHVAEEIDEAALSAGATAEPAEAAPACSFRIAGGAPGAKVSWRVEAVRNDRWVQQRGAPVEVEKDGLERGTYQHPELYGQPPEMGMNYDAERERRSDDRPSLATAPDTTRQK